MNLKTGKLYCFIMLIVALMITPLLAEQQPNVLIILTDDQGYGDLSLHGNPHIKTPHMDSLGRSGVRFERFYVNSVCAPSRAALLTGRWPLRTGCHGVTHLREAMRSEEITLAEVFQSAGYHTACFGKWHNGAHYPFTPQGQGFETFLGFTAGHWNNYFNATLLRGSEPEKTKGYISDVLTDETIGYITQAQNKPFFCLLAYNAPHSPFQVPDKYFDRFKQAGFEDNLAAFWGMVENLDDNIGRLLLENKGAFPNDRTLFIHNGIDEHNKWPGAVRTQQYRLVRKIKGAAAGSSAVNADHTVGAWQLYDMIDDPGEKKNLAAKKPDVVEHLATLYDEWYADISTPPPRRPLIPAGHKLQPQVILPAHHATCITPPLHYAAGGGFAHDWLTNWTNLNGQIAFDIDVQRSGVYALELAYASDTKSGGARICVSNESATLQATLPAAPPREIKLPHRDRIGVTKYRNRTWASLQLGSLNLSAGANRLTVLALSMPSNSVMDFKHLSLTYVKDK